ncbi:MAG TPA: S-adenosylmethionine tRNA ribosyltransferase [Cryomorphaceae bacterium]|nr:S-adenosylmethionine tRNA ribosyltransferase [Cryomorphaceae bacterium]|tara:strand:- start:438 stop:1616 length:1179 start_codon:yes stop_codon:yes gene_type:complete
MQKSDFIYDLPQEKIATHPLKRRDESKFLVFNGAIRDHHFSQLPILLPENSQLVFNNTKVIKARLRFTKIEVAKPIEVFCLNPFQQSIEEAMEAKNQIRFECMVGNLKRWKDHPLHLELKEDLTLSATKGERSGQGFVISFTWTGSYTFSEVVNIAGQIPLPPYMNREAEEEDIERYQTIYASKNGSVAAPTAGLHFTPRVLQELESFGHERLELTLHVGAGTFKPLGDGDISTHKMHAEEIIISRKWLQDYLNHKGPKFAVGTTSLRMLESCHWIGAKLITTGRFKNLAQFDAYELDQKITTDEAYRALIDYLDSADISLTALQTQLMIRPGYRIKSTQGIITNFHQPGSTLLLLVCAGIGEAWRRVYTHALENNYRFLSYGDSSMLYFNR